MVSERAKKQICREYGENIGNRLVERLERVYAHVNIADVNAFVRTIIEWDMAVERLKKSGYDLSKIKIVQVVSNRENENGVRRQY